MGNFWYLMVEMFGAQVGFFKKLYLLLQLLVCCFIFKLISQVANNLDMMKEQGVEMEKL